MRILFVTDRQRFWRHFVPIVSRLEAAGHDTAAAAAPGKAFARLDRAADELVGAGCRNVRLWRRRTDMRRWLAGILAAPWDVAVMCAEHLTPMRWVKPLLREAGRTAPVLALQHGVACAPGHEWPDWCDHYLVWGRLGAEFFRDLPARGVPVHITGTPRFDFYQPDKAEDRGFILAIAGHTNARGGEICDEWLAAVDAACPAGRPIVVKVHPNDLAIETPAPRGRMTFVAAAQEPAELLRTCHAVYLDYPSTYWLEATGFGKPAILRGEAARVFGAYSRADVLMPGDAAGRMSDLILRCAEEGRQP